MDNFQTPPTLPPLLCGEHASVPPAEARVSAPPPSFPLYPELSAERSAVLFDRNFTPDVAPMSAFPQIPQSMNGTLPTGPTELQTPLDHVNGSTGAHLLVEAIVPPSPPVVLPDLSNIFDVLKVPISEVDQIYLNYLLTDTSGDDRIRSAQKKLTTTRSVGMPIEDVDGYVDEDGYVIEWQRSPANNPANESVRSDAQGEGTYFTAIAVIALATGTYEQGSWEAQNAQDAIRGFLDRLEHESWGNTDSEGWTHPIRHPAWFEYYGNNEKRNRPMSRDAFNQIVLACFYAHKCHHGSATIRQQAQGLLSKWINYLAAHSWVLHSRFIPDEFQTEKVEGANKAKFAHLFGNETHTERITALGRDAYTLWPHELWALRNCAICIGVPHGLVLPPQNLSREIDEFMIFPLVRQSGEVIEWLYDRLQYEKRYSLDLVPGWKKSRVSGKFSIGLLPAHSKRVVREIFENAVRDQLLRIIKTGKDIDGLVGRALESLSQYFHLPALQSILQELMTQLLPWTDPIVLAEILDFLLALQVAKAAYAPASAGYSFWAFTMELEARPYLRFLFEYMSRDYFAFIAKKDNPNGLWAWLAGRNDVVVEHLGLFESQAEDYWTHYAYGENAYNEWKIITEDKEPDRKCSRVDYLVLNNLAKRGRPDILLLNPSLQKFLDLAEKLFQEFVESIMDDFLGIGYVRNYIDAAGRAIRESFSSDAVEQVIRSASGTVLKNVFRSSGQVEQASWAVDGTFQELSRYAKIAENGLVHVDDLIENQLRTLDGALKQWTWGPGKVLTRYVKFVGVPASGATSEVQRVLLLVRDSSGALSQWVHAAGVLRSFTQWGSSDVSGYTKASECAFQKVRSEVGELMQWTFHPDGALKEFSQWLHSTFDGGAESIDLTVVSPAVWHVIIVR
jgi:hypothetical protein